MAFLGLPGVLEAKINRVLELERNEHGAFEAIKPIETSGVPIFDRKKHQRST